MTLVFLVLLYVAGVAVSAVKNGRAPVKPQGIDFAWPFAVIRWIVQRAKQP